MLERFTRPARDVVVRAQEETARLGHDGIGTEHLLLGVAGGDGGILRSLGVELAALRAAVAERRRDELDAAALATIGIDLDAVRRSVEQAFGPGALAGRRRRRRGRRAGHRPFSPRSKRVLQRSLHEALSQGDREIRPVHILLGLAGDPKSGAARALRSCGTTPEAARAAVLAARRDAAWNQGAAARTSALATKCTAAASRSVNERMCSQQVTGPSGSSNSACSSSGATPPASR
jgi:ATP-dependent Clp protease ATP-binding subunit ClpA